MIEYRERVSPDLVILVATSVLVAAFLSIVLREAIGATCGDEGFSCTLFFFTGFSLMGFCVAYFSYGVRVDIGGPSLLNGPGYVLSVLGTRHTGRMYIPCESIVKVERVQYSEPIWRVLLNPFSVQEESGHNVVTLPGYRGTGLVVTYSHNPLQDTGETRSKLQFPTRCPAQLMNLLQA